MRAALQVEAEIDLLMRKPRRQPRQARCREQVREREQEAQEHDAPYEDHLPSLKMQHGCLKLRLVYGANRLFFDSIITPTPLSASNLPPARSCRGPPRWYRAAP